MPLCLYVYEYWESKIISVFMPNNKGRPTDEVNPKSWTLNQPLIIQLSIVVSSVLYRAHSF